MAWSVTEQAKLGFGSVVVSMMLLYQGKFAIVLATGLLIDSVVLLCEL